LKGSITLIELSVCCRRLTQSAENEIEGKWKIFRGDKAVWTPAFLDF
jgi:hypothetical protein